MKSNNYQHSNLSPTAHFLHKYCIDPILSDNGYGYRGISFFLRKEVFPMAEVGEVYRCEVCGMVIEVKEAGGGELVCCDQPMVKDS